MAAPPRRQGFVAGPVHCAHGHRMKEHALLLGPGVMRCDHKTGGQECGACVYVLPTHTLSEGGRVRWIMDLTWAEACLLRDRAMPADQVLDQAGALLPPPVRAAR